jgi:hypothetical protein
MATDVNIQLGYKDSAWFTANAAIVLLAGQIVYLDDQSGTFKLGDGVTALSALSFLGGSGGGSQSLQDVITVSPTVTGILAKSADTLTKTEVNNNQILDTSSNGSDISTREVTPIAITNTVNTTANLINDGVIENTTVSLTKNGVEVLTVAGGSLTGKLDESKSIDIAGGTTIDLSTATGNLVHITGSGWTCTSLGTLQAGSKFELVFDTDGILTNSANLILIGGFNIQTAANDSCIVVSEGGGIFRMITYTTANDGYISYTPVLTGFSSNPGSITSSYKFLTRNTIHWQFYATTPGTSNATTFTITAPLTMKNGSFQMIAANGRDNGTDCSASVRTRVNSNIVDCYKTFIGSWTASGNKTICFSGVFQIEL